jgi:hypothetical protein
MPHLVEQNRLERTQALQPETFIERYIASNRPVIVTDAMREWPALKTWTPEEFRARFGDEVVQIYDDLFFMISKRPLRDYIDRYILQRRNFSEGQSKAPYIRWYSRQDARTDFPWSDSVFKLLENEWNRPYFTPERNFILPFAGVGQPLDPVRSHFPARGIFISARGSRTRLHVDPWASDALLCQVYGEKRFLLFPPAQVGALTMQGKLIDIHYDAARDAWIDAPLQPFADGHLRPGEIIFIPAGWAHAFYTTTPSISVTWNFVHAVCAARLASYVDKGLPAMEVRSFEHFRGPEALRALYRA